MRANDVMSTNVITVPSDATVYDAAFTLLEARVSAVPVVDADGKLAGILSEGDLMRRPEIDTLASRSLFDWVLTDEATRARDFVRHHSRAVADVMTREVITAGPGTSLGTIAGLMEKHRIKRVPIVRECRPVGIVSRADLLRALIARQPRETETPPADEKLRQAVLDRLKEMGWTAWGLTGVAAAGGVVQLSGYVDHAAVKKAYQVAAETVPGVRRVENHMKVLAHMAQVA